MLAANIVFDKSVDTDVEMDNIHDSDYFPDLTGSDDDSDEVSAVMMRQLVLTMMN